MRGLSEFTLRKPAIKKRPSLVAVTAVFGYSHEVCTDPIARATPCVSLTLFLFVFVTSVEFVIVICRFVAVWHAV